VAPVREGYGTLAGQPHIHDMVTWVAAEPSVVIAGERGRERFEETIA
jgi:hypothetical protein